MSNCGQYQRYEDLLYEKNADILHVEDESDQLVRVDLPGVEIVFGEEDNFDERFFKNVSLESLGCGENGKTESYWLNHLEERYELLPRLNLVELKNNARRVALKDIHPKFDPDRFTEAPQDVVNGAFLKGASVLRASYYNFLFMKEMATDAISNEIVKQTPVPILRST